MELLSTQDSAFKHRDHIESLMSIRIADLTTACQQAEARCKWLEEGLPYIKQFWTAQPDVKSGIENAHGMNIKIRKWLSHEPKPQEGAR